MALLFTCQTVTMLQSIERELSTFAVCLPCDNATEHLCCISCCDVFCYQLYRPLNMYVALVGVEIWTDADRIAIVDNADATMNNFLEYRRNHISPIHPNDNAHLIT